MIVNMYDPKDEVYINKLKKSRGIKLISKYLSHIDVNKQCYIVNSLEEWQQIKDKFPDIVTCRTDTEIGTDIPNIHGTTSEKDNIDDYIIKNSQKVDNPSFICIELEPGSNERIYTKGGFLLNFDLDDSIKIGYVGPGFDCGECCKGLAEHETWVIPWKKSEVYRKDAIDRYRIGKIKQIPYADTAITRMVFLIGEYKDRMREIIKVFPKRYVGIDPKLFYKLQKDVIIPLWEKQEELKENGLFKFGVELNVVDDNKLVPFEIEMPDIFKTKYDNNYEKKLNKQKSRIFFAREQEKRNLMRFRKAKGIVLASKYLPSLIPFSGLKIVSSKEEWEKIKDNYPDILTTRTDTIIGDLPIVKIDETTGSKEEIPNIIDEIKKQNPNGVLLILEKETPTNPKYENDGGFNVAFYEGDSVVIELVGKGFDSKSITREKAVHERYIIPWDEISFVKDKSDLIRRNYLVPNSSTDLVVNKDEYSKQRQERLEFLESKHEDMFKAEKAIPTEYKPVDIQIIKGILDNIVFELYKNRNELLRDGLRNFNVQGNIVDGKTEVLEFFRHERLKERSKGEER